MKKSRLRKKKGGLFDNLRRRLDQDAARRTREKREKQRLANVALQEKRFPMLKQARLQKQKQFQNRVQNRKTWRQNHPGEAAKKDRQGIDWVRQHITFGGKPIGRAGTK